MHLRLKAIKPNVFFYSSSRFFIEDLGMKTSKPLEISVGFYDDNISVTLGCVGVEPIIQLSTL